MKGSNRTCVAGLPRNVPSCNTGKRFRFLIQVSTLMLYLLVPLAFLSYSSRIPLAYPLVSLLASQGIYFSIVILNIFYIIFLKTYVGQLS